MAKRRRTKSKTPNKNEVAVIYSGTQEFRVQPEERVLFDFKQAGTEPRYFRFVSYDLS